MVNIVHHGHYNDRKFHKRVCTKCHCMFEYEESDIKPIFEDRNDKNGYYIISCPECDNQIKWIFKSEFLKCYPIEKYMNYVEEHYEDYIEIAREIIGPIERDKQEYL